MTIRANVIRMEKFYFETHHFIKIPYNMKNVKLLFVLAVFIFGQSISANAQVQFGVKAGLNLANLNYSDEFDTDTKMLPTYMAGVIVEFPFSDNLGLGTGIQLQGKGAKGDDGDDDESKATMSYLQVPVQLQYTNNGLFAAVGPYVAFGIGGKFDDGAGTEEDISYGSSIDDDFSALDFGVNLEVGYSFGQLRATASYGLGLANGIPADVQDFIGDGSVKHAVIGVSLAYLFGSGE